MDDRCWDAFAPGPGNETRMIVVSEVTLGPMPATYRQRRLSPRQWETWLHRDSMYVRREYNWKAANGQWRRAYAGIGNGRHRLRYASEHGPTMLALDVIELAFWPAGERPLDRRDCIPGDRYFLHLDFDPTTARWSDQPDPFREVDCD